MGENAVFVSGALHAWNGGWVTLEGRNGPVTVVVAPAGIFVNGERVAPPGTLVNVSVDDARSLDRHLTNEELADLVGENYPGGAKRQRTWE